ncbi:ribosomal RNA small subunit methyltransferase A [Candidatus Nomurabacteria bacterium RIFCSPHIGHO2_02_FULL_35_13]|uniref:Ribosomal RNA small subunit methyltransferase A n=1 Tax=Candidatus Nomurabacteria bacterium RIFCSPHIGHO2_02_FULL_35_13 TaxID=1801748 RepID=A0A1F6VNE5_9BACT|nr:MAG: ribosomal RNA small subunit methyltransferase A [Candidatus Nomurabacteria bacterium RIFCSPHIGHO2_02_FULL_35_13]
MHKPKKSLGQNFLKSIPALNKIVEAGEVSKEDIILEIGPGKGALTEKLLEKAKQVIAVETDQNLSEFLKIKFKKEINEKNLILVKDDILNFNTNAYSLKPKAYKLIANIPYNITGAILKKFLTEENQPERMVLMVQNEVAKRITASDGKESILSVSVKAYGGPKIVMKVPARYFSPSPNVDSAVIAIKNISRKIFIENKINEEKFWEIVRAGFAHKRKKLSSNLKTFLKYGGIASVEWLGNKRAEELTLFDWIKLVKMI